MPNTYTQSFAFWPDGTFCLLEEVDEYLQFASDDYEIRDFDSDEDALAYINEVAFNQQSTY